MKIVKIVSYIFLCCLCGMAVFVSTVQANPIEFKSTRMIIYQNNTPIDDTINFSVKCYTMSKKNPPSSFGLPEKRIEIEHPDMVYSYSMTCSPDNCTRRNQMYPTWGMKISSCDLEGTYKEQPFFVENFTTQPEPDPSSSSCVKLHHWSSDKKDHYALASVEDKKYCDDRFSVAAKQCGAIERSRNISWLSTTEARQAARSEYVQCGEKADSEKQTCYQTHSTINVTDIDQLSERVGGLESMFCQQRLDIPLAGQKSGSATRPAREPYLPQSPVESLYCGILSIFGAHC